MRLSAPLLLLALAACGHTEPSGSGPSDFDGPFVGGGPLRLTYSPGSDRTPQWSTNAGYLFYAFDGVRRPDSFLSGCVAELPAGGGSRGPEICETDPNPGAVEMRPYWPARRPDGATAIVRQYWQGVGLNPTRSDLALQRAGEGQALEPILPIPYFATQSGRTHSGISHLQWLDATHLVYVGRVQVASLNETVNSGIEIAIVAPDSGLASLKVIPGTQYASSVVRGATSDTIYYTLGGSSFVYRRTLSSGIVNVVYDFASYGIARDVQVRSGRVVAVVGGSVSFHPHASFGMVQDDLGGPIFAAMLPGGAPLRLADTLHSYRHLALAPDGALVVAERNGDLWRVALP